MQFTTQFPQDHTLNEAISVFCQHNWRIGSRLSSMVQVEKPKGMPRWRVVALVMLFNVIGLAFVVYTKLNGGKERVTVMLLSDGHLQVITRGGQMLLKSPAELDAVAKSVKHDLTWRAITATAAASTFVYGAAGLLLFK